MLNIEQLHVLCAAFATTNSGTG